MNELIAEEVLARARRTLKRRIAATLIMGMAETDASYETIAARIGWTAQEVETWITGLITGASACMDEASDLAVAMGCVFDFHLTRGTVPAQEQATDDGRAALAQD